MQPLLLKIGSNEKQSFQIRKDVRPNFHSTWHYHEEFELTLILKSNGTRFVGDNIQQFDSGDLVLVGENVPHVWKNDDSYFQEPSTKTAEAIIIHFRRDFAGSDFFLLPEMKKIGTLLDEAQRGLLFSGKTETILTKKITQLLGVTPFSQFLKLIEILNIMAESRDHSPLSSPGFLSTINTHSGEQINRIYEYIIDNFRSGISLEQAAQSANLTPTAFCRFFKSRTRKTFTRFLNEVRIGFACRLLMEDKLDIVQVCFESGFNNLSYFYRLFKLLKKETPSSYRNRHKTIPT